MPLITNFWSPCQPLQFADLAGCVPGSAGWHDAAVEAVSALGLSAAVDAGYLGSGAARAALVVAEDPLFGSVSWSATAVTASADAYLPGDSGGASCRRCRPCFRP
jgi:hypothetical protein